MPERTRALPVYNTKGGTFIVLLSECTNISETALCNMYMIFVTKMK